MKLQNYLNTMNLKLDIKINLEEKTITQYGEVKAELVDSEIDYLEDVYLYGDGNQHQRVMNAVNTILEVNGIK